MWIYFLLLVLVLGLWLFSFKNDKFLPAKTNKVAVLAIFLSLALTMTLRFDIGFDYWSYESIYKECAALPFAQTMTAHWKEAGFYLVTTLLAKLGVHYHVYLFIFNLAMVGCVLYVATRYSKNWYLSIFLFITLHFMAHDMNFLRQSMAACIAFLGWKYLKEGSFLKYALVIVLAATFHVSVLIMLPAYFFLRLPFHRIALGAIGVCTLVGYFVFNPLVELALKLDLPYMRYVNTIWGQGSSFSFVIFPLLVLLFAVLFYKKLLAKDTSNSILLYAMVYNAIIYLFITKMFIIERFSVYFFMYIMLLLPEIIALFDVEPVAVTGKNAMENKKAKSERKQQKDTQIIVTFCIVVACLGYFLYGAANGFHKAYPYVSIWEPDKIISNEEYLLKPSHL